MNSEGEELEEGKVMKCDSCGRSGNNDVKLLRCANCHISRYCGKLCQRKHWTIHKQVCRRLTAELKDEQLFKQPESNHLGDCPICCLPMPVPESKEEPADYQVYTCCMKIACYGCCQFKANYDLNQRLTPTCPFCRETLPNSKEKHIERVKKRAADGSPFAIWELGMHKRRLGDIAGALDCWHKAAELGSAEAHYELSKGMYVVVDNNTEKFQYHAEQAAMGGHPVARYNLGVNEMLNGNPVRAVRHWTIAARQGSVVALRALKKSSFVSEEEYNAANRAQQKAMKEMESDRRNKADAARRR